MRIAIHRNDRIFRHSTNWSYAWEDYCRGSGMGYSLVDCFENGALERLRDYDILVWHFSNYSLQEMLFARSILQSAKSLGLSVFPDFETSWHFDDKVAEIHLLQSVRAPLPRFWIFYDLEDCEAWLRTNSEFPLVAKLRSGAGSENIRLIKDRNAAIAYAREIFGPGFDTTPSVLFKARTQWRSSRDWTTLRKRILRIPDLIWKRKKAKSFPRERGYAYFQEFVPNAGFDIKIVVIGNKLSFICRKVRKGDFRASGSGDLYFDRSAVTRDMLDSAFSTSDRARFQCMGYDYIVDQRDGRGKIVEISYGFSHTALKQAGGYWDRAAVWHDDPLNAPQEVLRQLIEEMPGSRRI